MGRRRPTCWQPKRRGEGTRAAHMAGEGRSSAAEHGEEYKTNRGDHRGDKRAGREKRETEKRELRARAQPRCRPVDVGGKGRREPGVLLKQSRKATSAFHEFMFKLEDLDPCI